MKKSMLAFVAACSVAVSVSSFAIAADIVGIVMDASGQAVNGSKISVADESGRIAGNAVTDQRGRYAIEGLRPGQYDIKLEPASANLKGDTAVGYLDNKGLTVNWAVDPSRAAIATARLGTQHSAVNNSSMIASSADSNDSPPGCQGMTGPPCGPKSAKK
jgi:Carboxypeptidase regulatory-like domain